MSKTVFERMHKMLNMSNDERTELILGKLPVFTKKFESVDEMEDALTEFMSNTNSPKRPHYVQTIKTFYTDKEYSIATTNREDEILDRFVNMHIIPYLRTDDLPSLDDLVSHILESKDMIALKNSGTEAFVQDNVLENKPEYARKDLRWLSDVATTVEAAATLSHRVISKAISVNDLANGLHVVAHQVWLVLLTRFRIAYDLQDKPVTGGQILITANKTMNILKDMYTDMYQVHKKHISDLDTIFEQASASNATRYIHELFKQNLAEDAEAKDNKSDVVAALEKLIKMLKDD